jgi:hypothetical protein
VHRSPPRAQPGGCRPKPFVRVGRKEGGASPPNAAAAPQADSCTSTALRCLSVLCSVLYSYRGSGPFAGLQRVWAYLAADGGRLLTPALATLQMRTVLYGKKAANLYTQAFVQNTQARALYQESEDTYYRANDAASYDDWRRARHQWDYFYNRH